RRVLHGDDMRRPRLIVDQRQLAKMLAHTEHAEDDFAAVLADEDDFDPALADDKERIARVILEQDDATFRVIFLSRYFGKALELRGWDLPEQGNCGEEVGYFHAGREHRRSDRPAKYCSFIK